MKTQVGSKREARMKPPGLWGVFPQMLPDISCLPSPFKTAQVQAPPSPSSLLIPYRSSWELLSYRCIRKIFGNFPLRCLPGFQITNRDVLLTHHNNLHTIWAEWLCLEDPRENVPRQRPFAGASGSAATLPNVKSERAFPDWLLTPRSVFDNICNGFFPWAIPLSYFAKISPA